MAKDDGLKVVKAIIKNFKNIDHKEIDIAGRSMLFLGPNRAGKSSLIQAILSPVNSKFIPIDPIKEGEERGHAEIIVKGKIDGEETKYRIGCYFSQEHKRGRLVLHNSEGVQIKGGEKMLLDEIIGDISFDMMEFIRMGRTNTGKVSKEGVRAQIEILKELMPKEDVKKLYALDHEKQEIYDNRTEINRDIKILKGQIEKAGYSQEDIDKYSEPLEAGDISQKLEKAKKINDQRQKAKEFIDSFSENDNELAGEIEALEKKLKKLHLERAKLSENNDACKEYLVKHPEDIDTSALTNQLNNISDHNTKHNEIKALDDTAKEVREKEAESDKITERLKAIDQEKRDVFASSKMPIKGLEFDDEKITFRGRPLSEDDIPTSQLMAIGLKIGMALNPHLKLLVIRDGSLLDEDALQWVLETCEKKGYQVLVELVKKTDGGDVEIEYVEK